MSSKHRYYRTWRMVREDWYNHLSSANRRIAEARERIENQKAHVRCLIEQGYNTGRALSLLRLLEETLQLMTDGRTNILKKVRTYQLPPVKDKDCGEPASTSISQRNGSCEASQVGIAP